MRYRATPYHERLAKLEADAWTERKRLAKVRRQNAGLVKTLRELSKAGVSSEQASEAFSGLSCCMLRSVKP